MPLSRDCYNNCAAVLTDELILSQGCTEPAAIAYASALCKNTLGCMPDHITAFCSGNFFKNAKSAKIPNTGTLKGIAAAAVAGVVGGDASRKLEVLSSFSSAHLEETRRLLEENYCVVAHLDSPDKLHIRIECRADNHCASVEIRHAHTHISLIEKDGAVLLADDNVTMFDLSSDPSALNPHDIYRFAEEADLSGSIGRLLRNQVACNVAICREGMRGDWGSNIGKLLAKDTEDTETLACAFTAAGSDARMSGCALPVVINSGSGNQGITVTVPVYVFAQAMQLPEEKLLRALIISNLMAVYQKQMIGKLSAYCGAVSAASGAGAAITYLKGGSPEQVAHTFANASACVSGILCDGAKPSCAAKIACSVYSAILASKMAMTGHDFTEGDGIVGESPEETIRAVGYLAKEGLEDIDNLILKIMYRTDRAFT